MSTEGRGSSVAGRQGGVLALEGLTRRFGTHVAVEGVSLDVVAGELLALVGASGSGKTTTLRMTAGYEPVDAGRVTLDGRDITRLPPQHRGFGMVFQHYALFPHMSVEENVAFGLEARGVSRTARLERARQALANVGLSLAGRRPVQSLSGGEQQRVALARALVIEPRVLLLDEPLSNLDPTLRQSMRDELRAMLHRLGVTALFVTHDQEDAFAVADRVALLRHGRLLQVGVPEDLYLRPASREVAEFIGRSALLPAVVADGRVTIRVGSVAQMAAAELSAGTSGNGVRQGGEAGNALAVLRPESLALVAPESANAWPGTVVGRRFAGAAWIYQVALADGPTIEVTSAERTAGGGESVGVRVARGPVAVVPAAPASPARADTAAALTATV